jgi:hypothetical protein
VKKNNGKFCVLKRNQSEIYTNNYNAEILKIWEANMVKNPNFNFLLKN